MTTFKAEHATSGARAKGSFAIGPARLQSGIVLATVLIALLLLTVMTFAAMESSSLGYRTVASMEERERSFQVTESVIASALRDPSILVSASAEPDRTHHLANSEAEIDRLESGATVAGTVRFRALGNAHGYDAVLGTSAVRAAHFVFDVQTRRKNHRFPSHHRQGVWRLTPSVP